MTTPLPDRPARTVDQRAYRLSEIDLLRGLVLLVMALDHVRDFPRDETNPATNRLEPMQE